MYYDPYKENGNFYKELLLREGESIMKTKIWLITAAALVLLGCVIFGGAMSMLNWDFTKLSTSKMENNDYEIREDYRHISITANTADINIVPSDSSDTTVSCYEPEKSTHSVSVKDGTLVIEIVDTRKWYEYIGINIDVPKITVYIPKGEYGDLSVKSSTGNVEIPADFKFKSIDISQTTGKVTNYASASEKIKIKATTGDICVENISAASLDLKVSTGKITAAGVICEGDVSVGVSTGKVVLTDIQCKSIKSGGDTGDIKLESVIAKEKLSVERSTGDVKLSGCDGAEIFIKTDTGDVLGSILSDKVFITKTDTGGVNVPKTTSGGTCEINTDTGDIDITIEKN